MRQIKQLGLTLALALSLGLPAIAGDVLAVAGTSGIRLGSSQLMPNAGPGLQTDAYRADQAFAPVDTPDMVVAEAPATGESYDTDPNDPNDIERAGTFAGLSMVFIYSALAALLALITVGFLWYRRRQRRSAV
ncbi:MAG: hypothetical protein ACAI44_12115 [Candidatus Sericytochromatia bacterium]